jgi:hypothetical protein
MERLLDLGAFLWQCYRAWHRADRIERAGPYYFTVSRHGVANTAVMIGRGRSAWTVADFAAQFFDGEAGLRRVEQREVAWFK